MIEQPTTEPQVHINPLYGMSEIRRRNYFMGLGYGWSTAQAIAEAARYLDAFTIEGDFFDFRREIR